MENQIKRILRIANILSLIAMPIVVWVTETLYWTVADDRLSINNPRLCWFFIFPFINAAALIVLLRQKVGAKLYSPQIEGLENNKVLGAFWVSKLVLWLASAVYMAYNMLMNTKTWDLNWQYCLGSLLFITPALVIHLIELLYRWWPVIRTEMTSEHNIAIRILFTGKTLLFCGIAARKTVVEKIIYAVRSLYWFIIVVQAILSLPSVFLFTAVSLYESFCYKVGVMIGWNYVLISALRLVELVLFDKD